ncbi:MAG: hypothetical protein A3D31_03645 [Candidatus Fluviicola riflensis]|nr:MAG: hypothetical protein CHH17_11385 [Candidatus Fluviicola riflensis]OGS79071.1 MAG: hypothetical protein A3D31_03645 [Candidatus Fluviicola riflensis]OGS86094.1 MAG: hypothetical protein A3E30_11135 [Fluviicola sp. RIFCSPHIGHO2_12_FULL_43_24]OGS86503.1 MAG: hypothetical protein A2724_03105 [Fluviicola sp. RIFCSPHIGHO2_01_FULL_43_53]
MPNTIVKRYYPRLSEVVTVQDLPEFLNFLENGLEQVFDRIHYKNLQYSKSFNGDAAFYSLDLVTRDRLQFPLPGGMQLVMNPDVDGDAGISSFPIAIEYKWEILAFVKAFRLQEFSYSLEDFYQLGLKVFRLTDEQVTANILNFFVEPQDANTSVYQQVLIDVSALTSEELAFPEEEEESFSLLMEILKEAEIPTSIPMILFGIYVLKSDLDETKRNLDAFYKRVVPEGIEAYLKKLITPKLKAGFTLSAGLEFPRNMLKPVYNPDGSNPFNETEPVVAENAFQVIPADENEEPKFMLSFGQAVFNIDTEKGLGYQMDLVLDSNAYAQIADTGFILYIDNMKLDLSKKNNIEEATLDGRPDDFIGAFIKEASISFPAKWNHDENNSTAQIFAENVLIGTGGISGTIGMRGFDNDPLTEDSLISAKFGSDFEVGLKGFELVFQQNAIISSDIHGWLKIPGFKDETGEQATIDINIHIGQDGEFNIVATADPAFKKIGIDGVFDFQIDSIFFGREQGNDGRFYIGIGGELDFQIEGFAEQFLPDKLDIKKLLIYDDGSFEFEGGKLTLPKAVTLKFGPATLSITGIHMGAYEKDNRKYKFFGFDGGVKTTPGGVEAHGKGLKYYYSVDGLDFDWFIRLESLKVDIILPSGTDPEKAAVVIRGFLSIAEPKIPPGTIDPLLTILQNSQEYIGGVSVSLPKFRGLKGSAAMRLNPKVPSFIVDLEIEMSKAIPLGTTGLGIYGFRALLGKKYVATKNSAGIPEDGEWWQYYKAKIDPDYKEGIQVSKFDTKNGFSFGAGVSLATSSDSGKIFSAKLFFLLSLPDVFLFQGQAQFLKERISLDTNPDPPFFAIIAITKQSIEAGFGVNYKLRDEGKLVTVDGVIELGFFWGDSSAWYVNVGRETPDDRRIQARLFDILNMYFYLMMSNNGIRLGAGVKFEWAKKFGPLSAELKAYIDTFGKISKRPKQIGGAIKMGGKVGIKVCGFGFSVSGSATLAAEAPNPHMVTGEFEVCVTVLKKERCARFEFTWSFNEDLDINRIPLLVGAVGDGSALDTADIAKVASMTHMVTGERFPLAATLAGSIPAPDSWITGSNDDYRVPVDAFLDIEFKKGMNVSPGISNNLARIGGQSTPAKFVEFSPPLRGKSDRVRHEFYLENVEIFYWDEAATPSAEWRPYDFYGALLPLYENAVNEIPNAIDSTSLAVLEDIKWGYWQQEQPGVNNKLRLLATTPLSYTSGTGSAYTIENFGVNDETIFCGGDQIPNTCITFGTDALHDTYLQNTLRSYENVLFRVLNSDGTVINTTYEGIANGLFMEPGAKLEIFFNEPMKYTSLLISSQAPETVVKYYRRTPVLPAEYGLNNYEYTLVETINYTGAYEDGIPFTPSDEGGVDYIQIEPINCTATGIVTNAVPNQSVILNDIKDFLDELIHNNHFTATSVELFDEFGLDYEEFFLSSLYTGQIPLEGEQVLLTQTHFTPVSLSFTITDTLGYSCLYTFNLFDGVLELDYSTITGVKSITMYPADDAVGANNNFLITFDIVGGETVRFIGSTCHTLSYSYSACATGFYKLCYLSLENYLLNGTIPGPGVQEAANATMIDSINKTLQPVWRPNTTFAVRITTKDRLYREGGSSSLGLYTEKVTYGFRTAGPIGHFHRYPKLVSSAINSVPRTDYNALDLQGRADEFRLTNLATYIDYTKSYPNADSQLINAKPLFYNNAKLRLFYLYNHVYQFYTDWADYEHTASPKIAESSLEIRILNPAPSVIPNDDLGTHGFVANSISHASALGEPPSLINEVNSEISILNNLLLNGNPCEAYVPMAPIDISSEKSINLKPLKLYTAQFVARYKPRIGTTLAPEAFESLVHSYVFQTSRYASFAEQVTSYILKTTQEGIETIILREAVYTLNIDAMVDFTLAEKVMTADAPDDFTDAEAPLVQQYAERFDQLMNGVFRIDANRLQAAVTTEFNLVRNGGNLIGILIRNPEPFNDPKIPVEILEDAITVQVFNGTIYVDAPELFTAVHSKDRSQVFITPADYSFDMNQTSKLRFIFNYKIYNGVAYENDPASITAAKIDLNNYSI